MDSLVMAFPVVFFIIVVAVIFRLQSQISGLRGQLERLSDVIRKQDDNTRALLNAYMNESRMMGFYREALVQCQDSEVVGLFQQLLKDEEKHIDILEKCLSN